MRTEKRTQNQHELLCAELTQTGQPSWELSAHRLVRPLLLSGLSAARRGQVGADLLEEVLGDAAVVPLVVQHGVDDGVAAQLVAAQARALGALEGGQQVAVAAHPVEARDAERLRAPIGGLLLQAALGLGPGVLGLALHFSFGGAQIHRSRRWRGHGMFLGFDDGCDRGGGW